MSAMTLQQALELALGHHQGGRLREAEALLRQILAQYPDQPDALHFLGLVAHQAGNSDAAIRFSQSEVSLPIHPFLDDAEVETVITTCNNWLG